MFKLGIVVASVDYREIVVFGSMKAWHSGFGGKFVGEAFAKRLAVAIEHKTEGATKDDTVWF